MKKLICILAIIILVITACSKADISEDSKEPQAQTEGAKPTAEQPKVTEQKLVLPADTYKILATDTGDILIMKYKIDPENKWNIKSATFEIRNFGKEPLKPKINFIVGTAGSTGELKIFEYDMIPPGYKMIKQEAVDMDIEDEHVYIKAALVDYGSGKEIASVNYDYFAK